MAPPKLYKDPHEQLVELLRECREAGLRFEDAWQQVVRPGRPLVMSTSQNAPANVVLWPTDTRERLAWRTALFAAKDTYRRAYERRPVTHRENAVVLLAAVLDRGISSGTAVRSAS